MISMPSTPPERSPQSASRAGGMVILSGGLVVMSISAVVIHVSSVVMRLIGVRV